MKSVPYRNVQGNLAKAMDEVCEEHSPVIITRDDGVPAVLMSLDDYRALEETAHLLRSPANAARLAEAIAQIETGKATPRDLIE